MAISRFWRTPAFPLGSGPDYVNGAAAISTTLSADAFLRALHQTEAGLGRVRDGNRWQARGVDLDLIAYGQDVYPDAATQDAWRNLPPQQQPLRAPDALITPHPRMQDRGFVLVPLAEIAPGWQHPRLGLSVAQMLANLPPDQIASIEPLNT